MPTDAKVGNPRTSTTTTKTSQKGKPLGIPKWGWIVGIALGLILGYLVLKHKSSSSSSSSSDYGSGSGSSPLGNTDSGSGGGASSGSPSTPTTDYLSAIGVTHTDSSDPGSVDGTGDSSTSTNPPQFTDVVVPPPSGVGAVAAGLAPNPGYSSAGDVAQRASVASGGTNTAVTAPTAPPPGSNVHIPGAQM